MKTTFRMAVALFVWAFTLLPQEALACSACMGDPNSNIAKGANAAIFLMLGLLLIVFGLLGAFALYLYKRSSAPLPPHAELEAIS
jgi:hypothetical protein